jgi:ATP-dependent RNA helicase DDX49/DBP8
MDPFGVFSIILAPTRELAIQVAEQVSILGSSMSVTVATIVGGLSLIDQARKLSKRPHFVVATPGRLRQLLDSPDAPPVHKVRYFVLDEADKLISMGFSDDLEAITKRLPPSKRTLLFSATITETLVESSPLALRPGYYSVNLTNEVKIPSQLKQEYILTPSE